MPSFKQAIQMCRVRGELPPNAPVDFKSLVQRYKPDHGPSMRSLLFKMEGLRPHSRWGIVVVTLTGIARQTTNPPHWYHALFNDGDGVGAFIRQMSGGRHLIAWRYLGDFDLYTPQRKAQVAQNGANAESAYLRQTLAGKGIATGDFDHFLWVIDQPGASGGTAGGGDLFIAAWDLTQQYAVHEMGHALGLGEGNSYGANGQVLVYGDNYCCMDNGPYARSMQNRRLHYSVDGNNFQTTGPGYCAPHLHRLAWLDYGINVVQRDRREYRENVYLEPNLGGPPSGEHRSIAMTVGGVPSGADAPQYWVEYRAPFGFDRWVDRPVSTNSIDMPNGAVVLHEVRSDGRVIYVGRTPAQVGNTLAIPGTNLQVRVQYVQTAPALPGVGLLLGVI